MSGAPVLIFSSERVQDAVGKILRVRWRKSGQESSRNVGFSVKKWVLRSGRLSVWTTCIRDQLTLEEPARKLARSFRGPLLLFPFAAGAFVVAPPDVPNAYAVRSVDMLERHLGCSLSSMQRDELGALLFDAPLPRPSHGPLRGQEVPGRAEAAYADRFVEAMRSGRMIAAPDADLFAVNGIYLNFGPAGPREGAQWQIDTGAATSSSEGSPPRISARIDGIEGVLGVLRTPEPLVEGAAHAACSTCADNRATICFLPCSHQCMCDDCARQLCCAANRDGQAQPKCPICRALVERAVRPFL